MAERRGKGRDRQSGLSDAERALWRRTMEGTRPLPGRTLPRVADNGQGPPPQSPAVTRPLPKAKPVPLMPKRAPEPDLTPGQIAGVARSQAERMKRGRLPIEARLDLHGHRQSEAHRELEAFLARAQATGKRCVLIVTGKGLGKSPSKDEGGVLRRMVPRWLNEPANRARILAFDQAQPKDGGMGALYVLLKRNRPG